MSYSLGNALTQSPEKLKITVIAVVGFAAAAAGAEPTLFETLGGGIALERLLDLFYAAPVRKANDDARVLESMDMGQRLLAPPDAPPQHAAPRGGADTG